MKFKLVNRTAFSCGDLVAVKTMPADKHFCIISLKKQDNGETVAILKALFNDTYIIEKPISELNNLLIKGRL